MYIDRIIEDQLKKLLADDKVVILLGARQVGKTTMLEPLVQREGGLMLNCDISVDRSRLEAASTLAPAEALQLLGSPSLLVIDEAQTFPEIGRIVKGWYDAHVSTKIVLLGSSSLDLLDRTAEPLTGRNEKLYLTPLLFSEVIRSRPWFSPQITTAMLKGAFVEQVQTLLLQQMVYGSYPATITADDKEKYLLNITSDYLLRDVLQSGLVKSPDPIKRLLSLLAYQAGSEVSIDELAKTLQIARPTVESYLEMLERSYVIFRLRAFSTNQRKEIAKSTKIFFWDTGIRNALLKEFSLSPIRSDIGSLFENWVVAEVAKRNLTDGDRNTLHYWRKTEGSEVDLVIKGTDGLKAYEIKWSKPNATAGSRSFSNTYNVPVGIITKDTVIDLLWEDTPVVVADYDEPIFWVPANAIGQAASVHGVRDGRPIIINLYWSAVTLSTRAQPSDTGQLKKEVAEFLKSYIPRDAEPVLHFESAGGQFTKIADPKWVPSA